MTFLFFFFGAGGGGGGGGGGDSEWGDGAINFQLFLLFW